MFMFKTPSLAARGALMLLCFAGGATAQDSQDPPPPPLPVTIDNFAFASKELTIPRGAAVQWINRDGEPHTIVSSDDPKAFRSPTLDTGDKFSFVFKEPGTYRYFCSVHPHMTGTIIVK
jgi:plastocyanin